MSAFRAEALGTFSFSVETAADAVFELVTPEGERRWDHSWDPRYLNTAAQKAGTVFETHDHGRYRVWLIDSLDVQRHRVRYVVVQPETTLTTIDVAVDAKGENSSSVSVTYHRVSLSPSHDSAVRDFQGELPHMADEWAQAFAAALRARR